MKKQKLLIFTSSFPFGEYETFLEGEILILSRYFEKIYIIPNSNVGNCRQTPANVEVIDSFAIEKGGKLSQVLKILIWKNFYKELFKDLFNFNYIRQLLVTAYYAKSLTSFIKGLIISKELDLKNTIFYTYWFGPQTYSLSELKNKEYKNLFFVSRLHGGDIYEYRHGFNRFPFREQPIKNINCLFPISMNGKEHLIDKYPYVVKKVFVQRLGILGAEDNLSKGISNNKNIFRIVSCSRMAKEKRIEKIINVLKKFSADKIQIEWIHIGNGYLEEELKSKSLDLPKNVKYIFMGYLKNKDVIKFYIENKPDIFINLSSSEGIPVSIMEAQSCYIASIATNVGGVSEIVNNQNGFLIEKNCNNDEIYSLIKHLYYNPKLLKEKKQKSYETWMNNYSIENYNNFCNFLIRYQKDGLNDSTK